jgi:hypothetical protein
LSGIAGPEFYLAKYEDPDNTFSMFPAKLVDLSYQLRNSTPQDYILRFRYGWNTEAYITIDFDSGEK